MFASIYNLYQEVAKGKVSGFTVPAFNLRVLTFDTARALFRQAKKQKVGAFIIELARSEMAYTNQSPQEYSQDVLKAAQAENWQGPIFLQGDHFKLQPAEAAGSLGNLIKEAMQAGFYNIDIDCSTLPLEQNIKKTNYFIDFIRNNQPQNIQISVGAEVGEIGGRDTEIKELERFLNYVTAINKVAVQTGTSHGKGGKINWSLLRKLNDKAREYGLAGVAQHGASTLPEEQFKEFPKIGVVEIHLATALMNTVLESDYLLPRLKNQVSKKTLGQYKQEISDMPRQNIDEIVQELEARFQFFFKALNVENTVDLILQK